MKRRNYSKLIHRDFQIANRQLPFNRFIMIMSSLFLPISYQFTPIEKSIKLRRLKLRHENLSFYVDVFEPSSCDEILPAILNIHGGGFAYCATPYQKKLAAIYANKGHCRVFFVHYHRLPKYRFPIAYEEGRKTYEYMVNHADSLKIDCSRIAIMGDSAGGAIAANLCNTCQVNRLPTPKLQILIYPVLDCKMKTKSMKEFIDTPLWNAKNNQKMWSLYVDEENENLASPMYNPLPDLLPMTYLETAQYDCLHDEGILYAKRLQEAGFDVEINETQKTIHGYDINLKSAITKDSIERRINALKKAFHDAK